MPWHRLFLGFSFITGICLGGWLLWEWNLPVYSGPWQTTPHPDINHLLHAHNLTHCRRYQYQRNRFNPEEYLVYCSPDGRTWQGYILLPGLQKIVAGPFPPDPTGP